MHFFCVIACLGGVPQNNTCFVWQVPGPEIHLDIYYNISNKDTISLVRGYLEKITMNNFQNKIKNMLSYFLFILIYIKFIKYIFPNLIKSGK